MTYSFLTDRTVVRYQHFLKQAGQPQSFLKKGESFKRQVQFENFSYSEVILKYADNFVGFLKESGYNSIPHGIVHFATWLLEQGYKQYEFHAITNNQDEHLPPQAVHEGCILHLKDAWVYLEDKAVMKSYLAPDFYEYPENTAQRYKRASQAFNKAGEVNNNNAEVLQNQILDSILKEVYQGETHATRPLKIKNESLKIGQSYTNLLEEVKKSLQLIGFKFEFDDLTYCTGSCTLNFKIDWS